MNYNYFLNTYSFQPPVGFDTREKQLKDAGVNTEECFMYGYGYYDCENPSQQTPKTNPEGSGTGHKDTDTPSGWPVPDNG